MIYIINRPHKSIFRGRGASVFSLWNKFLLLTLVGFAIMGRAQALPFLTNAEDEDYVPNPLVYQHFQGEVYPAPPHKIVPKSVNIDDGPLHRTPYVSGDRKSKHSLIRTTDFHFHEGRERSMGSNAPNKPILLNQEETESDSNEHPGDQSSEEKLLQEIIASRREAYRSRIRNSSELHIDNHKNDDVVPKTSSKDSMHDVVVLPKPFHFHLPIVSNPTVHEKKNSILEPKKIEKNESSSGQLAKLDEEGVTEISEEEDSRRKRYKEHPTESNAGIEKRNIHKDDGLIHESQLNPPTVEKEAPPPVAEEQFHSLRNPKSVNHFSEETAKSDLDALIDKHPKLIPPINRKRNSGNLDKQDALDDESHHFMMVFKRDPNEEDIELTGDQVKTTSFKREVKTINFSQGVVDSILGHGDDLQKYQEKIKSHAEKLGVEPLEVFHKVVYGNSSNDNEPNKTIEENSTLPDIQQRRHQFQQLFLSDSDDSEKRHNEIVNGDKTVGEGQGDDRYSAYMKVLKRERRGIKSWFKKIFHRGDDSPKTKRTTTTTTAAPKKRKTTPRGKPKKGKVLHQQVDENGDTEVDLLLPTQLRRSSLMKQMEEMKQKKEDEEELEEEYEKSEEKEVKTRSTEDEDNEESEADNNSSRKKLRRKSDRKLKTKRSVDDVQITPIAENMENQGEGERITEMSKDEILLVHEMFLNIVNFRCGEISRAILDNILTTTQSVIKSSNLPEYFTERRHSVDLLFDQILKCSSNEENLSKWIYPTKMALNSSAHMSISDIPHKRTKRIRRGNVVKKELFSEGFSKENSVTNGAVLPKLLKIHVLLYKLILETCWQIIDPLLLHDSEIILIEELIRTFKAEGMKPKIDSFATKIDLSSAENSFRGCYKRKQ